MGLRDGGLRGRPRRIGDADEREEREAVDRLQEVAGRVERGRVEVLPARGHESQPLLAHPVALGEVGIAQLRDRDLGPVRAVGGRGALEELVLRALDVGPDDLAAALVGPVVEGGHELVGRVERQGRDARVLRAGQVRIDAALGREDDERALVRVADERRRP